MLRIPRYAPSVLSWFELHAVDHCNQSCVGCNNHSPFFRKREYLAEEYYPWIDEMIRRRINFHSIGIIGGEPFLHRDLAGFVSGLAGRYGKEIWLTTNGYWLSDAGIDRYADLWGVVDRMWVTFYDNVVERVGGRPEMERLLARIGDEYPVSVGIRDGGYFVQWRFSGSPTPVGGFCHAQANCTNLLADGRLARCAIGGYAGSNPLVTPEFLEASRDGLYYDLREDTGEDFAEWRRRWPLPACQYCNAWKGTLMPWVNDPQIRRPDGMKKYLPVLQ